MIQKTIPCRSSLLDMDMSSITTDEAIKLTMTPIKSKSRSPMRCRLTLSP